MGNIHTLPLLSIPQESGFLGFFSRLIENFLLRNKFLIKWKGPEKVLMLGGGRRREQKGPSGPSKLPKAKRQERPRGLTATCFYMPPKLLPQLSFVGPFLAGIFRGHISWAYFVGIQVVAFTSKRGGGGRRTTGTLLMENFSAMIGCRVKHFWSRATQFFLIGIFFTSLLIHVQAYIFVTLKPKPNPNENLNPEPNPHLVLTLIII